MLTYDSVAWVEFFWSWEGHTISVGFTVSHTDMWQAEFISHSHLQKFLSSVLIFSAIVSFFRDEIAACAEKAYCCISFSEAARILYFDSEKDMKSFAEKVRSSCVLSFSLFPILLLWSWEFSPWLHFFPQRGWLLKQDNFYYFETETDKEAKQEIPAYKMIQHMLEYAKELERIVWQLRYLVLQMLPCTLGYLFVRNLWLCLSLCSKYIISEERFMVDTLFRFSHPLLAKWLSSYFGWIMNPGSILPAACISY